MKEVIAMRAVQVTDDDIAFCISAICTKLLGRPVKCRTNCDVSEYWGAFAEGVKFTVKELLDLLVAVNADAIRRLLPSAWTCPAACSSWHSEPTGSGSTFWTTVCS